MKKFQRNNKSEASGRHRIVPRSGTVHATTWIKTQETIPSVSRQTLKLFVVSLLTRALAMHASKKPQMLRNRDE
jgi:hypothetical protein